MGKDVSLWDLRPEQQNGVGGSKLPQSFLVESTWLKSFNRSFKKHELYGVFLDQTDHQKIQVHVTIYNNILYIYSSLIQLIFDMKKNDCN